MLNAYSKIAAHSEVTLQYNVDAILFQYYFTEWVPTSFVFPQFPQMYYTQNEAVNPLENPLFFATGDTKLHFVIGAVLRHLVHDTSLIDFITSKDSSLDFWRIGLSSRFPRPPQSY